MNCENYLLTIKSKKIKLNRYYKYTMNKLLDVKYMIL
jgi:hypothetical protein